MASWEGVSGGCFRGVSGCFLIIFNFLGPLAAGICFYTIPHITPIETMRFIAVVVVFALLGGGRFPGAADSLYIINKGT